MKSNIKKLRVRRNKTKYKLQFFYPDLTFAEPYQVIKVSLNQGILTHELK